MWVEGGEEVLVSGCDGMRNGSRWPDSVTVTTRSSRGEKWGTNVFLWLVVTRGSRQTPGGHTLDHITFSLRLPRYPRIYKPRTCIFLCVNKYGPHNCVMESVGASGKWKTTFLSKYLSYHYKIKLSVDIPDMEWCQDWVKLNCGPKWQNPTGPAPP